jgi:hypothetical protein
MLALPLKLDGARILDANGMTVAKIYLMAPTYAEPGAEIVAAVNSHADVTAQRAVIKTLSEEIDRYAALLAAAKEAIPDVEYQRGPGQQLICIQAARFRKLQAAIAAEEAAP